MDQMATYIGWMVLVVMGVIALAFTAWFLWVWLSTAVGLWYISIKTDSVKQYWMAKRFWRARLLIVLACQTTDIMDLAGSKVTSEKYTADFTGFFPRFSVKG